ncbi:MAG: TIGR02302 family protein, partial [Rhodobacterales bacterium CG2_30_65_12]
PLAATVMAAAAVILWGVLAFWPAWIGQALIAALALAGLASLVYGIRRFRPAHRAEALARLDATLPGSPIAALADTQAIGADDPASQAVWLTHRRRMAERLAGLRALPPRPGLSQRDPYGLRLIAATALAAALLFGAGTRQGDLAALLPGAAQAAISQASWEGWIEAPSYTGKPTLYLADQPPGALEVPTGSRVTLRLYGRVDAIDVAESFSGETPDPQATTRAFRITGDGTLAIGDDTWQISATPDAPPRIQPSGELTRTLAGEMRLPFTARDDYGVSAGQARIGLDLLRADRRHGLGPEPEPRDDVVVDLAMPYRGDRHEGQELLVENLSENPWAGLPVTVTFSATDAAGQSGESAPFEIVLPGRRFLDPLAAALVEQRRDILWTIANAPRAARILRAVSNRPEGLFAKNAQYLKLRTVVRTLDGESLTREDRDAVAQALWEIAVEIEDGALANALDRLRRAQERLSEAMRQGATPEELSELMDDYRQALRDYTRQLGQQEPENRTDEPDDGSQQMEMTQQDLQAMMDRIEELMRQGRMEEAQALLDQLQQMMENMQITEGASGQQGQSQGERSMQDLADTLRQQQGLSDQAFRNLQEQLNPGGKSGQPGTSGEEGEAGETDGQGQGQGQRETLTERQRALERELERQRDGLPGAGTPEGDAARDALERAGRAMDEAADALDEGNIPGALDRQAEAMESLRDGMRTLEDQMRREAQAREHGEQGQLAGQPGNRQQADPLGRTPGGSGATATDNPLGDREDVYRRAQELMEELRRRSGEADRPELERDYLKRLLDLF